MADTIYFSKIDPAVKLFLGTGEWLAATKITDDIGVITTNNPKYIAEIRTCVARGVGGVSEISAKEYQELQKKKNQPSLGNLREQVSAQQIRDYTRSHRAAGDAGGGENGANGSGNNGSRNGSRREGAIAPIEYKPVVPGFKPESVKR